MALQIVVPQEDIRIVDVSGDNIYIEWLPLQPQTSYEIQYKLAQIDAYSASWRTCGVVQDGATHKYNLKSLYNFVGYDFYEVFVRVKVTYSGTTNLGEITGEEVSDVKSIVFTHGINNTLKVYDGCGTREYPLYKEFGTTTGVEKVDIAVDNNINHKLTLPIVRSTSSFQPKNIMEDSQFNVLFKKNSYYSYMHPAKEYTNYSSGYDTSFNRDHGYSSFSVIESYYVPRYDYNYAANYAYQNPTVVGAFKYNYNTTPTTGYTADLDVNYPVCIEIQKYGNVSHQMARSAKTQTYYHTKIYDAGAEYTSGDTTAFVGDVYYVVQIRMDDGELDVLKRVGGFMDSYIYPTQNPSYTMNAYAVKPTYSTFTLPETYMAEQYDYYTHFKYTAIKYDYYYYKAYTIKDKDARYNSYNVSTVTYSNSTYRYAYAYRTSTASVAYKLASEGFYYDRKYDGIDTIYMPSLGYNTYAARYKDIKRYNGITYSDNTYSHNQYAYYYQDTSYTKFTIGSSSGSYMYYYYYNQDVYQRKLYSYYSNYYIDTHMYVYRQVPATYTSVSYISGQESVYLYTYCPFYAGYTSFVNGGLYDYYHHVWYYRGYRIFGNIDYGFYYYYHFNSGWRYDLYDNYNSINVTAYNTATSYNVVEAIADTTKVYNRDMTLASHGYNYNSIYPANRIEYNYTSANRILYTASYYSYNTFIQYMEKAGIAYNVSYSLN